MKNTLLITASVAALVAGIGLASAQGLNERRDAPAAATSEQKAPDGQTGHEKSTLPQKTDKMKPAPTAQAPETVKPAPTAQAPEKAKPAPIAQAPETVKPAPTAQAPEKAKPAPTAQAPEKKTDSERQTVARRGSKKGVSPEGGGVLRVRADVGRAECKIPRDAEGREGRAPHQCAVLDFDRRDGSEIGSFLPVAGSNRGIRPAISRL